jgi:TRAP-type C4-dicarboxylate transport system permease small subunit
MNMKKIVNIGILLEDISTQILLSFIVLLVFLAAASRFSGYPINWSVDIAQALFVWVIFIGANQAWRKSRHIGIDMLFNLLSPGLQKTLSVIIYTLISVFLITIIINGVYITVVNSGRILNDIPISYSFVTLAVPAGALLMLITTIEKITRLFPRKQA